MSATRKFWLVVVIALIVSAPNYITASNLRDMSEVKSTLVGGGVLAIVAGLMKLFGIKVT